MSVSNNKNTLVMYCLQNDTDASIERMGYGASHLWPNKRLCKYYELEDFIDLRKQTKDFLFDEVVVLSHHRFFGDRVVEGGLAGVPLPLHARTVGGIPLIPFAAHLAQVVFACKAKEVVFYGCEMATSAFPVNHKFGTLAYLGSLQPSAAASALSETDPNSSLGSSALDLDSLQCTEEGNESSESSESSEQEPGSIPFVLDVATFAKLCSVEDGVYLSSLVYMSAVLRVYLSNVFDKSKDYRSVSVKGLNGIGYIRSGKLKSFKSEYHPNLPDEPKLLTVPLDATPAKKLSMEASNRKAQEKEIAFVQKFVETNPLPTITYEVSPVCLDSTEGSMSPAEILTRLYPDSIVPPNFLKPALAKAIPLGSASNEK